MLHFIQCLRNGSKRIISLLKGQKLTYGVEGYSSLKLRCMDSYLVHGWLFGDFL